MENNRDFQIKQRGKLGELYTVDYLKKHGYSIITSNYFSRYGEIDIVAENEKYIVFVEVKTKNKYAVTNAFERITESKIKKMIKTALTYITRNSITKQPRIDCAEVVVNADDTSLININYIENAVYSWEEYL